MAIAAEHPVALAAGKRDPRLAAFIEECRHGTVIEAQIVLWNDYLRLWQHTTQRLMGSPWSNSLQSA